VTSQLREDMGPEFDDLREHLSELQRLRGMTPRAALTKHLLDGDDSIFTGNFDKPVNGSPAQPVQPTEPVHRPELGVPPASGGHAPGHTPFDTDAT
jgi:sec-independent protein translocase protein TatB